MLELMNRSIIRLNMIYHQFSHFTDRFCSQDMVPFLTATISIVSWLHYLLCLPNKYINQNKNIVQFYGNYIQKNNHILSV